VHRRIPGTLQEESIQGTFIPVAGSEEKQVANWLNKITCALEPFIPPIPATSDRVLTRSATAIPLHSWTSETSRKPVKDALMSWKPNIILQENLAQVIYGPQPEFSWKSVISFIKLTSSPYSSSDSSGAICSTIIHKGYAIFASQPNRRFMFGLSIASQKFCAHMFDHSGVVHSCGYDIHRHPCILLTMLSILAFGNIDHIGYDPTFICQYRSVSNFRKIKIGDFTCDIVRCFFYHFLIHGQVSRPCPTPGLIWSLRSHRSSTAQLWLPTTYSGRACTDTLQLSTSLGLCSIHSLPHLTVYPVLT